MGVFTQFAYRTQKAIGVVNGAPVYEPLPGFERPEGNLRCCCYSPDGRWFAWASPDDVKVVEVETGAVKATFSAPGVHEIAFSPRGSYIMTWERPTKQDDGNAAKNLKVWNTETTEEIAAFVQKTQVGWNLQYTYDEKYCARAVTNTIQFYETSNMNTVWNNLRVEGVTEFALSPGKNYSVAVFVAERKGAPAIVRTYNIPDFVNSTSQKSFFKADKVQMQWNQLGTQVLVLTQTEVDKTGKSYYGETNLYLLSAAGNFDCRVSLDKEGPIHDVTWSPNSREFGVVYGYMPAKTTFFDARANVIHSLPLGPRNTIQFSPHGRLILVAGFGNLQGQMDIYDRERDFTKIATIEASNASVCEWSPDGQHILTATTSPRLRVDNCVKIWHFTGGLMYLEELNELYNVYWCPQPASLFPLGSSLPPAPEPHNSAVAHVATNTPTKPAGAYRPPHARGSVTPLHFKREDEGGAAHVYTNGSSGNSNGASGLNGKGPRRREVPGATPAEKLEASATAASSASPAGEDSTVLSKTALKNKKKREAAKKAKELAAQQAAQQNAQQQQEGATGAPVQPQNGTTPGQANQLTVDGKPVPTGPASDRKSRDGSRSRQRGDRSRSRNKTNSPHRGPNQNSSQQGGGGGGGRRSKSRNQDGPKHQRGQSGDVRNNNPNNQNGANAHAAPQHPLATSTLASDASNTPGLTLTVPTGVSGPLSPVPGTPSTTEEKKLRGLHKKLRAIEDLKLRLAAGEKLEDTQLKKIATEEQVRRELEMLGGAA